MIQKAQGHRYTEGNGLVRFDPRLRERHFGVWQGRPRSELYAASKRSNMDDFFDERTFRPEGGETAPEVTERAKNYITDIVTEFIPFKERVTQNENISKVLIVTHGGFIREFINAAIQMTPLTLEHRQQ